MRFGRYIVGIQSQDVEALATSKTRDEPPHDEVSKDVNGTEQSDADAIV